MTYIERLNEFNRWLESNALPGNAQLMYFRLLNVFNRAGWPESVQVDTLRLMALTDCQKAAAYRARDKLVETGFIGYKKGSKGKPTAYFLFDKETEYGTKNGTENGTKNGTLIKNKNKNKNKTKSNFSSPVKSYDIKELEELSHLRLPEDL